MPSCKFCLLPKMILLKNIGRNKTTDDGKSHTYTQYGREDRGKDIREMRCLSFIFTYFNSIFDVAKSNQILTKK